MKKSKKIIVFICLFFLCFNIVTEYKREEVKAIALVDDALLWAFGMLVLGTGVVAIKDIQVPHMGSLVLDNLKSNGVSQEEFLIKSADGVLKGIKIYDKVLNAVNSVADSLTGDTVLSEPYPYTSGEFTVSSSAFPEYRTSKDNPYSEEKFYNTCSKIITFHSSGPFIFDGKSIDYFDRNFSIVSVNVLSNSIPTNKTYLFSLGPNYEVWSWEYNTVSSTVRVIPKAGTTFSNLDNYTYIPYSNPVVKENYNPTYTDQNLPYTAEKPGFIPLPSDTIMDKPISTELPLTWDDVKGGVTDLPLDNTVPGENTGENEGENEGSLDGALDDIFNPSTTKSLDFSPLYISFSNKFPFCIPFDLARIIGDFKANKQDPIFYVDMSGFDSTKTTDAGFSIDFTKFTVLFGIVRTFILVSFVVFLAIKTRDIIKA